MNYVSVKHPLVFFGIPSLGFLYVAVLEAVENTNLAQITLGSLAKLGTSIATSPFLLVSVALSIGSALLFSQKEPRAELEKAKN